jgi:predicted ATPase/DNA-binding SARP family transcriptional activator
MFEVRLLGRFDIQYKKKPVLVSSRPAQSLFAYLILNAGTSHRREKLAGMLWPDSLEETARDNLRHALWRVRKALPIQRKVEYLLTDDLTLTFNASAEYWLDAAELEKVSENTSADELIAVLSEYQGELLPGFYEEWVILEREHLHSIFEHHMARLMSLLQEEKRWLDILDWGERWIRLGQKPEPAYRALMSAHAAKGDMSKVAATYERCVRSLRELGIEPSQQTRELFENLKLGKEPLKAISVSTNTVTKQNISSSLPTGTVTFLFTDIEGSTKLAQAYSEKWENLRSRHHTILRNAVESNNGFVFQSIGDAFCTAFHTVRDGFQAALDAQRKLQAENWGKTSIKVRMGLHTGAAEVNGNEYLGYLTLVRVQRVMSAAHGGQILVSNTCAELLHGELQGEITLRDMKEYLLKDLPKPERLWQIVASDIQQDFPPLQLPLAVQNNLPVPLTSFVGREKEVKEIARLLSSSRLITLTGPGGVGKTRLAIQTAHDSIKTFKDGVFWVGFVGLSDENLIPQEIAQSLNMREISTEPMIETLKTYLKSKDILIVLDNCEHLIRSCAQHTEQLLGACPKLKILATSRERLDLFNETTWNVPSLPLPEMQQALSLKQLKEFASIQLFVERARNVKSDFVLTEQNASSIAQICNRLDGIPLAIELASARIKLLSVDEIASRLSDRFSLLTSGTRTAQPRQQTLRAVIDWSHDLLTEPERILFRRLAVFAGGFTLDAVEVVCSAGMKRSDILDLLGRLVDKSLVVVETDSVLNETRYRLLETIRQYARIKLEEIGEVPDITEQHLNFFASFASQAEKKLYGKEGSVWFLRLEKEIDNLRAAMYWPVSMAQTNQHKSQSIHNKQLLIVGSLDMFWETRYRIEILQALEKMLASTKPNEPTIEKAKALSVGGFLLLSLHKFSEARVYLDESIDIAEKLADLFTLAQSLGFLGWTFDFLGEYDHAKTSLERSVTIARSLGEESEYIAARSLSLLGDIPFWQGKLFEARQIYEEAISFLREIHDRNMLTYPLRRLGYICLREGDVDQAIAWFGESLEINHEIGHFPGMCACLAGLAAANLAKKNFDKSAMLCGYVENLLERIGAPFFFIDTVEYDRTVSQLKRVIAEKAFAVAWSKGRTMTMEQAILYALEDTKI